MDLDLLEDQRALWQISDYTSEFCNSTKKLPILTFLSQLIDFSINELCFLSIGIKMLELATSSWNYKILKCNHLFVRAPFDLLKDQDP